MPVRSGGETMVTYGPVTIRHVLTQSVEQTEVLDPSGTDLMYHKFSVRVSGLIHGQSSWCQWAIPMPGANVTTDDFGGSTSNNSGTETVIGCRAGLPPRQPFRMTVNNSGQTSEPDGETLLIAYPMEDPPISEMTFRDVKNGPRCTKFNISKIAGGNVYSVDAEFEIHLVQCAYDGSAEFNTRGVLSNRWSATDSLDNNRRLTRSYVGTLVLASNNYNPSMFRGMLVPPIQTRMRRDNMQFTVSEDGLTLRYTFVDVQQSQAAPAPASHWEIDVTNSCTIARIMKRQVSGVLIAPDDDGITTAADLLLLAWYIIGAKVHNKKWGDAGIQVNTALLENITFSEHIGERTSLSFTASFQLFSRDFKPPGNNDGGLYGDMESYYNYWMGIGAATVPPQADPNLADFAQRIVGYIGQPLRDLHLPTEFQPYNPLRNTGGREISDGMGGIALDGNGNPLIESPYHKGICELATLFLPYLQTPCNNEHDFISGRNELVTADTNATAPSTPQSSYPVYMSPSIPEAETAFFSNNHAAYPYTVWKMSSTIKSRTMRAAMPIAKAQSSSSGPPEDDTKFVKLSGTQCRRIVRIHAERIGDWPELPDLETLAGFNASNAGSGYAGPTQKLLKSRQLYALPESSITGQLYFTVGVEATYGLSRAPKPAEQIPIGRQIWNKTTAMSTREKATNSPIWTTNDAVES